MWFEERSWSLSQMKMSSLIVEEWRDIWSHKAEYMLIGCAYLFATTNFLNFARLVLENGGLAFIAAYGSVLLVVILPIIIMELGIGQLTGRAPVQAFYNICPTFKGVGVAQLVFSMFVLACMTRYLARLLMYIFYLFWSIVDDRPGLPWLHCKNFPELQVSDLGCREPASVRFVQSYSGLGDPTTTTATTKITTTTKSHFTTFGASLQNITESLLNLSSSLSPDENDSPTPLTSNLTALTDVLDENVTSALSLMASALVGDDEMRRPPAGYNRLNTLHDESALNHFIGSLERPSDSIASIGDIQFYPLVAQCCVWIGVFVAICFGVRWLGKVVTFTFLTPFVLLVVFAGRCMLLTGAVEMFITMVWEPTDWRKLENYMVWKTATEQALLASGIGFGAFITIGSYSKRSNNLVRDSLFLVFSHVLLTTLQTVIVIALVGYVSTRTGLHPPELLENGENQMWQLLAYMAFIPHTKILTAVLLILCTLALLNVFFLLSLSVTASLEDCMGEWWTRCLQRFGIALLVALTGAALSFFFTTQAGKHVYELATGFLKYMTMEVILTFELLAISWFYGAHSLGKDLRSMLPTSKVSFCFGYFLLTFTYLLPTVPIVIGVANMRTYSFEQSYSAEVRKWAPWSEIIGALIAIIPLLPIPLCAFYAIYQSCRYPSEATKCQRLRHVFRSPMRYDLIKTDFGDDIPNDGGSGRNTANQVQSSRYSAAAPGYVLLPQQQPQRFSYVDAPLAQPENYQAPTPTVAGPPASSTTTTVSAHDRIRA